ncbi:MAG: hypothetical protein JW768_13345 [Chitinispirillaceae bacterium]|nr:hypothetical protein [Chitinispirillaceae bacterium]
MVQLFHLKKVVFSAICFSVLALNFAFAQTPVLDEFGKPTGLINMNPDPNGEPWIAGGLADDEELFDGLPVVALRKSASAATPPASVNNTAHEQFRPIFNQSGGSCAQASAIGYIYTYEINVQRNLPSNVADNQYPYDFTYNFLNQGSGSNGSSQSGGWSIVQYVGIPNATDYGGFGLGDHDRWVSGYDVYYSGMANRLQGRFSISIQDPADIEEMKQYLYDHANGSEKGGLLGFGSDVSGWSIQRLPEGTPEAGTSVVVRMGEGGGHAMTIAGYHDGVCWDYNEDGRYTNDVDINGDGTVDLKDWEKGAVLMVNSWGTRFGTQGKAYIPYRLFVIGADSLGTRGSVTGITLLDELVFVPKLTFKVSMSHDSRGQLRLRGGYNTDASASAPSSRGTTTWGNLINYRAGDFPMLGAGNNDPLEIGLDVTSFLPSLSNTDNAFFLLVDSRGGNGTVHSFSLLDYTGGGTPVEYKCEQTEVDIPTGALVLKIVTPGVKTIASAATHSAAALMSYKSGMLTLSGYKGEVSVYNLNGARMLVRNVGAAGTVDLSILPNGMYMARAGDRVLKIVK